MFLNIYVICRNISSFICYTPKIPNICFNIHHIIFLFIMQFDIQIQSPPKSRHSAHDRLTKYALTKNQNRDVCVCQVFATHVHTHMCKPFRCTTNTRAHHAHTHAAAAAAACSVRIPPRRPDVFHNNCQRHCSGRVFIGIYCRLK